MNENLNLKKELAAIDERIEILKVNIKLGESVEALHENPQFKDVILDGYLDKEADRIFGLLVDPTHQLKRDSMENLIDKLSAIRNLKQFFGTVLINATMAPEEIAGEEEYRKELTARNSITGSKE